MKSDIILVFHQGEKRSNDRHNVGMGLGFSRLLTVPVASLPIPGIVTGYGCSQKVICFINHDSEGFTQVETYEQKKNN